MSVVPPRPSDELRIGLPQATKEVPSWHVVMQGSLESN